MLNLLRLIWHLVVNQLIFIFVCIISITIFQSLDIHNWQIQSFKNLFITPKPTRSFFLKPLEPWCVCRKKRTCIWITERVDFMLLRNGLRTKYVWNEYVIMLQRDKKIFFMIKRIAIKLDQQTIMTQSENRETFRPHII